MCVCGADVLLRTTQPTLPPAYGVQEITRRVNLRNIWQAAYTAGVVLPKPVCGCRYWHRSLNPKKLIEVRFSSLQVRTHIAAVFAAAASGRSYGSQMLLDVFCVCVCMLCKRAAAIRYITHSTVSCFWFWLLLLCCSRA
jgi:hypothetical protein